MDRKIYSEVRNIITEELKRDLIGPNLSEKDIITEAPTQAYITGILYPLEAEITEEEELADVYIPKEQDKTAGIADEVKFLEQEDEGAKESPNNLKITNQKQSSCGLKFYVSSSDLSNLKITVSWGEYIKQSLKNLESGKSEVTWERKTVSHTINLDLTNRQYKEELLPAKGDGTGLKGIYLVANKVKIKDTSNYIVSVFLMNRNIDKTNKKSIFQVNIEASAVNEEKIFINENKARSRSHSTDYQEFLYRNKPVFSKGFGCAVEWQKYDSLKAGLLNTSFIPAHEVESMSTELPQDSDFEDMDNNYFSIRRMAKEKVEKNNIIKLTGLADRYENWINKLPLDQIEDQESAQIALEKCQSSLSRIRAGIDILENNPKAYQAFVFMNEVMHTQISMKNYSKDNQSTTLEEELEKEAFGWRPFQLSFILLNIKGVVERDSADRELVDLLWFPTGGGKTEAYLGIIAFLLAYRRLTNEAGSIYDQDGGVTVILRYTLRLLTTQQRDRLMRLVAAAEYIRSSNPRDYGEREISIGFWAGSQVTANKLKDLQEDSFNNARKIISEYEKIKKQVIECPCCGTKNPQYNFLPNQGTKTAKTGLEIKCKNDSCFYYDKHFPIYLIDEEIYRKTPSILISTVDKFARLPWDEKTGALFGKVDRYCERCGFIAVGENHPKFHSASPQSPKSKVHEVKPFYPPELIIQDELHLITGPLGTIYGLYETAIEELATANIDGQKIKPKYIAATATIKNAEEQVKKVFGRMKVSQFPPAGLSVEDSFFGRELDVEDHPFRLYTGICVSGHSMKTVLLRVYAVLLQVTETMSSDPKYTPYINYLDPYRTLVGYFNSVRELGGTVRLLEDDVRKRINTLKVQNGYLKERYPDNTEELTSRIPSYKIPKVLELLTKPMGEREIDVALATNMISVGMDVDRLGLMVVTGQPKQTSEYIQASSRVGRNKPGLVVTIYNPYRARDLSHYENFKGYHSRLYNYVEGTTATPYAARARDRALHALAVAIARLNNSDLASDENASNIKSIDAVALRNLKEAVKQRVSITDMKNMEDTVKDLDRFIDKWISLSTENPNLQYYKSPSKKRLPPGKVRLLSRHNDIEPENKNEFDTLDSMRQIESTSKVYIFEGWDK